MGGRPVAAVKDLVSVGAVALAATGELMVGAVKFHGFVGETLAATAE